MVSNVWARFRCWFVGHVRELDYDSADHELIVSCGRCGLTLERESA